MKREHNQYVARRMRERHGVELTPEQVQERRGVLLEKLRVALLKEGLELPEGEEEALRFLAKYVLRKGLSW